MFTHDEIWQAIDKLAQDAGYSTSGLAKKAGLDPTAFNKSKRLSPEGKPRWPSTESLAKVLAITNMTLSDLMAYKGGASAQLPIFDYQKFTEIEITVHKYTPRFDAPKRKITVKSLMDISDPDAFAVEISNNTLAPIYRRGDVLIISPRAQVNTGDRLLLQMKGGEMFIKEFVADRGDVLELQSCIDPSDIAKVMRDNISWLGRIIWVSQ